MGGVKFVPGAVFGDRWSSKSLEKGPRISIERRILQMAMSQNYQPTPKIGPNQGVISILADEF